MRIINKVPDERQPYIRLNKLPHPDKMIAFDASVFRVADSLGARGRCSNHFLSNAVVMQRRGKNFYGYCQQCVDASARLSARLARQSDSNKSQAGEFPALRICP